MSCENGFAAVGEVRLIGAHIHDQLSFNGATLSNREGNALNLYEARVPGSLWLLFGAAPQGAVRLDRARVGALHDHQQTWPTKLHLRGLTYDHMEAHPEVPAKTRLGWIERDSGDYEPQPYEQLAAVYRQTGHEPGARQVAIAKQRRRRGSLGPLSRTWSLMLDAAVGHGYRPWLAVLWLLAFWAARSVLVDHAYPEHVKAAKPDAEIPIFQPMLYTLDLLLPFVNLQQRSSWIAECPAQLGALLTGGWLASHDHHDRRPRRATQKGLSSCPHRLNAMLGAIAPSVSWPSTPVGATRAS